MDFLAIQDQSWNSSKEERFTSFTKKELLTFHQQPTFENKKKLNKVSYYNDFQFSDWLRVYQITEVVFVYKSHLLFNAWTSKSRQLTFIFRSNFVMLLCLFLWHLRHSLNSVPLSFVLIYLWCRQDIKLWVGETHTIRKV